MDRTEAVYKAPTKTGLRKGSLVRLAQLDESIEPTGMRWEFGEITKLSKHGELVNIKMEDGDEYMDAPLFDVYVAD